MALSEARSVACPTCDAGVGRRCIMTHKNGKTSVGRRCHAARYKLAKEINNYREEEGLPRMYSDDGRRWRN